MDKKFVERENYTEAKFNCIKEQDALLDELESQYPDGYSDEVMRMIMKTELPKRKYHKLLGESYLKYGLDFFQIRDIKFERNDTMHCGLNELDDFETLRFQTRLKRT